MVISFSLNFIQISLYKTTKCYDIKDCETKVSEIERQKSRNLSK